LTFNIYKSLSSRARIDYRTVRLGHDPHEEEHELKHEDQHDGRLEELAARHRGLFDREAIDVVERLELGFDVGLPGFQPRRSATSQKRRAA
jgi:hypothetical protein